MLTAFGDCPSESEILLFLKKREGQSFQNVPYLEWATSPILI